MNSHGRIGRSLLGLVAIIVLVLGDAAGAAADVGVAADGDFGYWELADRANAPGANCEYLFSGAFRSIRVRPPLVFARDLEDARESQFVAWRFDVERSIGGGPWNRVYRSSLQKVLAYDDEPAPFSAKSWSVTGSPPFTDGFRVKVLMRWYRPSDTVEGAVTRRLEFYLIRDVSQGGGYVIEEPLCPGIEP